MSTNSNDLEVAIRFTTAGGQVVVKEVRQQSQALKGLSEELDDVSQSGEQSAKSLHQVATGSQKMGAGLRSSQGEAAALQSEIRGLIGITGALAAGFFSFGKIKEIAYLASDYNTLQERIRSATRETFDFNSVSKELFDISQKNGAVMATSVDLFQRLGTSRKDLKASNDQILALTDSVQMLGVIGGASTAAMDNGLQQLSQGLAGGIVRAEEWNSVLENIPMLAARIGMGLDDIGKAEKDLGFGEMRALVNEGKLLSEDVLQSILIQLPEIRKEFEAMPLSMDRAAVMVDNSYAAMLSRLDKTLGVTEAWAESLKAVSQTMDTIGTGNFADLDPRMQAAVQTAEMLAYVIGVAGTTALAKYAIAQLTVLKNQLLLNTQSVSTVSALGLVTMTTGTATVATNALAIAQRALLGPVGAVLAVVGVAALAFDTYKDAAEETKKKNDELAKSFEGMHTKVKAHTYQQTVQELQSLAGQIAATEQKLADAKKKANSTSSSSQFGVGNVKASADAAALAVELANLQKQQKELNNVITMLNENFDAGLPAIEEYSTKTVDGGDAAAKLKDELLKLYNAQMLSAQAVDSQGRALSGIDLELFKASFKDATELPKNAEAAIKAFAVTAEKAQQLGAGDKYLVSLKEEVRLQQMRLVQGEAEYELAKAMSAQKMTDPAQLKQLKELLATQQKLNQAKASKDALTALKTENDLLQIKLDKGEHEYQLQKAIRELNVTDPAVIAQLDAEIQRQALLNEQLDVRKYLTDGSYDDLLDSLKQLGDVGGAAGNALVNAFGSVADQFERMAEQQEEFTKKFAQLGEVRKKVEKDTDPARRAKALEKADSIESHLYEEQFRMQMGNYATLTGAASKMFSENSKGRQIMHRMETTFAAIETALALKKAAANALTAITNQGSGDPYTAFARIAAMMAIMAGLGVFSGGSSGGAPSAADVQAGQGTGTVLGDSTAKSESIANALERIESLELDQYGELRSINTAIRELSAGIKNLAVNLVANYGRFDESNYQGELGKEYNVQLGGTAAAAVLGGVIGAAVDNMLGGLLSGITNKVLGGLFGSTKKELVDSGISFAAQQLGDILSTGLVNATIYDTIKTTKKKAFGLSKSTREHTEYRSLDEEVREEFGRVFSYLGKSVTDAVSLLGLETTKSLENFVINIPKLSFKDLSGDEIEKELNAIFSQQGDLMAKYLVPGIAEFQQMGEGLYDTLIRVAQEQAVFNSSLDALGLQLSRFAGVTKQVEIEVAQSLIELMGGIEEFSSATAKYFEEFYSETEQQAYLAKLINEQFAALNLTMPATREQFKSLIDGLDLTTESGQALFAALMSIIDPLDQFYDGVEDAAKAAEKAAQEEKELAEERLAAAKKLAEERAAWVGSIESELSRLNMTDLERSLDDTKKWYDAQIKEAAELGASTALLEQLYARKRQDIINAELDKINADTERQLQTLTAEHDSAVSQLTQQYDQLFSAMANASSGIASAILDIRRSMTGWDESGYQAGQIAGLRGQLGTGTLQQQIDTITQLQSAIVSRYQADMSANTALMEQAQQRLDDLNSTYDELQGTLTGVSDTVASAILDIRRSMVGWDESSYQAGQITDLRGQLGTGTIQQQISIVEQLQSAIVGQYQADLATNNELMSAAQQRLNALNASYEQLQSALAGVGKSISAAILDIQRQATGWDEISYQAGQIADLRSQLGTGSVLEQISVIEQLQSAISSRYKAEMDANKALQSAANDRYQADLASYNALRDVAKQLTAAADDLLIGELSPLLMGDQFKEAQRQFTDLLKRAQGGDADAAQQLSGVGSSYLKIAQDYLASGSSEYNAIFNQIQSAYRSFGSQLPGEPAVPQIVRDYQAADAAYQQAAIAELTGLQALLAELDSQARTENDAATAAAQSELAQYQAQQLALQTATITELTGLQALLAELDSQARSEYAAATAAAQAELAQYQAQQLSLQTGTIDELTNLQQLLGELDSQARAEQADALAQLNATFESAKNELLAAAQQQIDAIKGLTSAVRERDTSTPPVLVVPPQPIVIEPIIVMPPSKEIIVEPPQNPILERTNELLQQQLQQAQAAQAKLEQQNRQLQQSLDRTQDLLYAQQRIA